MKLFLITITSLLFFSVCKEQETGDAWQDIYLSPGFICRTVQFANGNAEVENLYISTSVHLLHLIL
jgi:hypothetical protein